MFSRLLTTATRRMSASYRKIARCPVKGGEKMSTSAMNLFIKGNYKQAAKGNKDSMKVLAALRQKFSGLTSSQLSKYKAVAKSNKQKIDARKAVFKQARTNAYALFLQRNYAKVAKTIECDPAKKVPLVGKALGKQWRALSKAGKQSYAAAALRIRKAAIPKRDSMIAKYSA
ncbi:high mobility group protein [Perkinsela sp. CCAP 1560/4]|nr:high mobility group protein [Perkinsela sp. CCAP 1560/4]|eukprot:KNH07353.1 high mobility group protein [Perkinsela sp. CCAP 1560/4]